MQSLDVPSDRDQGVYVFTMTNGDPQAAVTVLQNMFQTSNSRGGTSSSSSSQNMDALTSRVQQNVQSSSSSSSSSSGFGGLGTSGGRAGGQY
jgi:hypothetical protein